MIRSDSTNSSHESLHCALTCDKLYETYTLRSVPPIFILHRINLRTYEDEQKAKHEKIMLGGHIVFPR